jgi:hypothetical protein
MDIKFRIHQCDVLDELPDTKIDKKRPECGGVKGLDELFALPVEFVPQDITTIP